MAENFIEIQETHFANSGTEKAIIKPAKDLFVNDKNRHDGAPVDGYQSMTRND